MIRASLCLFGLFAMTAPTLAQGPGAVPRRVSDCAVIRITELGSLITQRAIEMRRADLERLRCVA